MPPLLSFLYVPHFTAVRIRHGEAGRLIVLFPYSRDRVEKIRMVAGRRWHHKEKYWTVSHTDGVLVHLLTLFAGETVEVDPSLMIYTHVLNRGGQGVCSPADRLGLGGF